MDIRLYPIMGYNRDSDDRVTEALKDVRTDMDMKFLREHVYTDAHRKKLDDFDILAKQMVGQRFGFFCNGGDVLSGEVTGFSWDEDRVVMNLHLRLDFEPEASIGYSVNVNSGLSMNGETMVITDEGMPDDPILHMPANSIRITL